jgi:hypothetical protein
MFSSLIPFHYQYLSQFKKKHLTANSLSLYNPSFKHTISLTQQPMINKLNGDHLSNLTIPNILTLYRNPSHYSNITSTINTSTDHHEFTAFK